VVPIGHREGSRTLIGGRGAVVIVALLVAGAAGLSGAVDDPSLKDVLRRMGAYVETYGEKASVVVATERYTQHVRGSGREKPEDRMTVADFAIVKARGLGGWVGFRDVVEADGARIADREDRLIRVLTEASGSIDEARRLSDESARFNIGPIVRNFNVPTAALLFFRPENLDRFKFTKKTAGRDGIWEIAFRETERPTLVRTPDGSSVPSEGSLWVNAANGTVVRTRLLMKDFGGEARARARGNATAQVEVAYLFVAPLAMWLPETMTESYEVVKGTTWERTTTEARYSDYRVFQTSVRIR
jgi:hypothetical protein